jgi:hypothetical protein
MLRGLRDRLERMTPNDLMVWFGLIALRIIATTFGATGVAFTYLYVVAQSMRSVVYAVACFLVAVALTLTIPRRS